MLAPYKQMRYTGFIFFISEVPMRLFYGLSLPASVRAEAALCARRVEALMPGRYGDASNYHITLAFLGEVAPERLGDVQAILAARAAQMPAPTITPERVDYFGRADNAILILRARCEPSLDALHGALVADLQACGLPADVGPFAPHITLARHVQTAPEALSAIAPRPLAFVSKTAHVFLSARDEAGILRYTPLFDADFHPFVSL